MKPLFALAFVTALSLPLPCSLNAGSNGSRRDSDRRRDDRRPGGQRRGGGHRRLGRAPARPAGLGLPAAGGRQGGARRVLRGDRRGDLREGAERSRRHRRGGGAELSDLYRRGVLPRQPAQRRAGEAGARPRPAQARGPHGDPRLRRRPDQRAGGLDRRQEDAPGRARAGPAASGPRRGDAGPPAEAAGRRRLDQRQRRQHRIRRLRPRGGAQGQRDRRRIRLDVQTEEPRGPHPVGQDHGGGHRGSARLRDAARPPHDAAPVGRLVAIRGAAPLRARGAGRQPARLYGLSGRRLPVGPGRGVRARRPGAGHRRAAPDPRGQRRLPRDGGGLGHLLLARLHPRLEGERPRARRDGGSAAAGPHGAVAQRLLGPLPQHPGGHEGRERAPLRRRPGRPAPRRRSSASPSGRAGASRCR